jgi:hypothetical protein
MRGVLVRRILSRFADEHLVDLGALPSEASSRQMLVVSSTAETGEDARA